MLEIKDKSIIQSYINMYHINDYFTKDLTQYMTLWQYEKNEKILISGDPMNYFYFVVDGKAKIFNLLENGKEVLLRFTRPLSELGSLEVLSDKRYVNSCVTAHFPTRVIKIPFRILDEHAREDVRFLQYLVKRLSHKLGTESKKSSMNITYPFKNRFASYLLSITTMKTDRIDEIKINKMTDLATYLGTSYRHLNRVIKEFEEEKIIEKQDKKFIILDFAALEDLSGGFYE